MNGRSACTGDTVDNVGLIVIAAVDQRAVTRSHLDHGRLKVLAEGVTGQVDLCHIINRIEIAVRARLTGKVDICLESEIEYVLILAEKLGADLECLLHQSNVAGALNGAADIKKTVAFQVRAVDPGAVHLKCAVALELVSFLQCPGLKTHGRGKRLGR